MNCFYSNRINDLLSEIVLGNESMIDNLVMLPFSTFKINLLYIYYIYL